MAGELVTGYLRLVPTVDGIQGATARAMAPAAVVADKAGKTTGGRFSRAFSPAIAGMGGSLAALFTARAIGGFLKDSIAEAREAQKVGKLTENVIRTTGGAANITAKEVGNLAGALSSKVGIDDEVIQSGANLLLTFKNIRNEAGLGNDIFNQATTAALDLSASGFGSVSGASKQLGKALNDPLKGIAALGRAGVTFTDQQKEQIKTLVKNGDVLGAQKIILKEVQSQVGGAAKATATNGEKMKVAFGNLKEQIGTALLPLLDRFQQILVDKIMPAMSQVIAFIQANPGVIYGFAAAVGALAVAFIAAQIAAFAIPLAIAALVGALVYAYTRFETFRAIVDTVFKFVSAYIKMNVLIITTVLRGIWAAVQAVIGFFQSLYTSIRDKVGSAVAVVSGMPGKIKGFFKGAGTWLKDVGEDIMDGLVKGIDKGFEWVKSKLGGVGKLIPGWLKKVLGISSPSRVMAAEVGRWILPGVADGIDPTVAPLRKRLTAALTAATRGVSASPIATAGIGAYATPAAAGAGANGGPTVQQDIYPQPGQSEKEIGDAAADRALWVLRK